MVSAERVRLPTDPTRTVKGVDVLPWVLGPLMGSEEYEMEVSHPLNQRIPCPEGSAHLAHVGNGVSSFNLTVFAADQGAGKRSGPAVDVC